jgi:photosystem II stability/assembly factor-like uncharacterized protein
MRTATAIAAVVALGAAASPRGATLEELVARNLEARGGRERLAALRSLHLAGKIAVTFGDPDSALELAWTRLAKRPGMIRTEGSVQGLTAIRAFDGRGGWQVNPFFGRREPDRLSADDAKTLARDADLDGPLAGAKERGDALAYLGTEDVDGTEAHKIQVTRPDGDVEYVYLDPDRFLEIRVETRTRVRGVEVVEERDLGNYERVEGVLVPFSIEAGPKGAPRNQRITVLRAAANAALDDALFSFPADGKPAPTPAAPAAAARPGADSAKPVAAVAKGSAKAVPVAVAAAPASSGGARIDAGVLSGLGARNIGSAAMSGRISAIAAALEDGKTTVFVGAASGGVWRSQDGGTTFRPVFDKMPVQSIGAIALDPRNPKNVWVGTGEAWTRNSVSIGDGVYRSRDGGETWTHVGLPASERVARIVVDPRDSEVAYACVAGKLWSDSAERGLYKTRDGGKTWALVLPGPNPSTGCSTVALAPGNPDHLLAGLWDFRRKGWTFRSGGDGPDAASGSALLRSEDGSRTWAALDERSAPGLPPAPWGRVEVAYAPSDARVVYAFVESSASALYRSSDGGRTWEARDRSQMMMWRPFYFARLVVDPRNPERLFKTDLNLIVSEDGGRSFSYAGGGAHGDWHDLWIDPSNPKHVVGGDDGGLWISQDGGSRWWKVDNLPVAQFYHVAVDAKDPYLVYGGLQDNATWVGPSAYPNGITNATWEQLYNSDGFWALPDPTDPDAVYVEGQGGYVARVDRRTHAARDIQPKAGYREKLRFNWNTPLHLSPTEKRTLYVGAQFLFRSRDRGDSWERISPDLTTNDPAKQRQEESGGITVDNSVAEMHTTIYSISESPKDPRTIWVGTDDGNLQLTRDGGRTWTNVAPNAPGLPPASWVSWVEASRFDANVAYAAFDRHTFGDMAPYVYRTADRGRTWRRIAGPEQGLRGWAHVVKEDLRVPGLLFVGTELGLWVSVDGGKGWAEFKGGAFPAVAVRDLQIHPRDGDLVLATHGRGIWIVDDLEPLRALARAGAAADVAFLPGRPVQQRMPMSGGWVEGDAKFVGQNPPAGAVISWYQRERHLLGPLQLDILDPAGKVIDTVAASKRRGVVRAVWSMRVKPPRVPRAAALAGASAQGPRVVPGTYRVRLTSGERAVETALDVRLDRRAPYGLADRKANFDAAMRVHALFGRMTAATDRIGVLRDAADARTVAVDAAAGADAALAARLRALRDAADAIRREIVATKEGGAITGEERLREHADILYGALLQWEGRPGRYQLERIDALERELADVERRLDGVVAKDVPPLDAALEALGLPRIPTTAAPAPVADVSSAAVRAGVAAFLGVR